MSVFRLIEQKTLAPQYLHNIERQGYDGYLFIVLNYIYDYMHIYTQSSCLIYTKCIQNFVWYVANYCATNSVFLYIGLNQ